jgi:predicted phosphodiesterase
MRIAVFNDIHGNLPAFEAALGHARGLGAQKMLVVGDMVIGAPDSRACFELAQSLGTPMVRGNNDRYVADFGTARGEAVWVEERFGPLHEAHGQMTGEQLESLRGLPHFLRMPEAPGVLFVHASVRNDVDSVTLCTGEDELEKMFPDCREPMIVRGHNHLAQDRYWGQGQVIVTSGSAGMSLDGRGMSQYLLLEERGGKWHATHQSVAHDISKVLARYRDTGYLKKTGPMGRLFMREALTGSHHLVPFLTAWKGWREAGEKIELKDGVDRYLNMY